MESESKNNSKEILFQMQNINMQYGSNRVLNNIDITINKGEIHAIIGEHGAGKSTLSQIMGGYLKPVSGQLLWKKDPVQFSEPQKAKDLGIEIVMQNIEQYDRLSVAQNLFGNDPQFFKQSFFSHKNLIKKANEYFFNMGIEFNAADLLSELKDTDKVLLELIKHLQPDPELLILDEAFEKMTAIDLNRQIPELKRRKDIGLSIVFITHRIDDVYTFADRVTVIRNGRILTTENVKNIDRINLIKLAYTQVVQESSLDSSTREFYQLLKYNRAILENLPINLLVVDEKQKIKLINNNAKKYFNLIDTPVISRYIGEILELNGNSTAFEIIKESLVKRKFESYNLRLFLPTKKETINIITTYPIYDESMYIGSMIIIDDITEQEKLREKLSFSEKLGSIGLLAAGVSHEINNPLEIIINEIGYLRKKIDSRYLQVLDNVEEEIESIVQIVSDLASFSTSTTRKEEILDIVPMINRILKLVKINADQRDIAIQYTNKETYLPIKGNRTEIKQIILNIIKNSFEAIKAKGELIVSLSTIQNREENLVQIQFTDTGPGIKENDQNNIFLPFFSNKGYSEKNMGLGLSVSYGIINKMNGTISLKNHPDGGCIATIQLPLYQDCRI